MYGKWPSIFIVLLAFALRTIRLDFQPLWWDEGYSVYFASMSLPEMVEATSLDIHPPLYYALLHSWIALAGSSPVALRIFSAVIGTITLPLLYHFARLLAGEKTAFVSALLLAFSPFHVYYSQEVRMYGLVTLLGLGATSALLLVLRGKRAVVPLYILLLALTLYTQYYAVLLILAHTAAILLLRPKSKIQLGVALGALFCSLLLYLPWVVYAGGRLLVYIQGKKAIEQYFPLSFHYFLARHLAAFGMGHMPPMLDYLFWTGGIAISILMLAGVWAFRKNSPALRLLLSYLSVPLLGGFAINLFYPFHPPYFERILLIALPPYLVLLAAGLQSLRSRLLLSMTLALMSVSLFTFYLVPRYPQEDYRPLAEMVSALSSPKDVLLCVYPWQIGYFLSYCPELCPEPVQVSSPKWGEQVRDQLERFWQDGRKVWFPAYQVKGAILESQVENYALAKAFVGVNKWFGTTRLLLFAPPAEFSFQPANARFGHELELAGLAIVDKEAEPTPGAIRIAFHWRQLPQTGLKIHLRLSDSMGRTWAQQDLPIDLSDRLALLVPAGTPPGKYEIRMKVYDPSTDRLLDVFDGQPPEPEPEFSLGSVLIKPPYYAVPEGKLEMDTNFREELEGKVRLLGYSISSRNLRTGDILSLSLFWQSLEELTTDYVVFVQIQDDRRRMLAGAESPPLYPTSRWNKGLVVKDMHSVVIPAKIKPGTYNLVVGMYNPVDGSRLRTPRGDNQVLIAKVKVNARPHTFERPSPAFKTEATFGSLVELEGYDIEASAPDGTRSVPEGEIIRVKGGWKITLTLYWHPIGTTDKAYSVFVHLVDESGKPVAFGDAPPAGGQSPTTSWIPGEYITDPHTVILSEGLPSGVYHFQVGFYLPPYGPRLPLVGGSDSFTLPGIKLILEGK